MTERDLAALADGSLAGARRAEVERAVAPSPELRAALDEQRWASGAIRASAARVVAPPGMRARVEGARVAAGVRRPARRAPRVVVLAAAVVAALVFVLGGLGDGGAAEPTVAQAATLGLRAPAASAPRSPAGTRLAGLGAAGLPFPYWEDRFGWRAVGVRRDALDGRTATTVFYRRRGRRVAYTIVSGRALPAPEAPRSAMRDRVRLAILSIGGRPVVTWLRRGHTCVLSGHGVPVPDLLRLGAWRGGGKLPY